MFQRIYQFNKRIKTIYLVLGAVSIMFVSSIVTSLIAGLFSTTLREGFSEFKSLQDEILVGVVVAPILETIIFQCAIIESFKGKSKITWGIFVSAIVFGSVHFYNPFYFFYGTISGFVLGFVYVTPELLWQRVLTTFSTHFLLNLIVFTVANMG